MAGSVAVYADPHMALLAFAAFAANAIRGLTGLGSAVIFVPIASMAWTAAMALAVSAVLDLIGNGYLCWLNRKTVELPRSYWKVVGALTIGILLGSSFVGLDDRFVRRMAGSVILVTIGVIVILSRRRLPKLPEKYSAPIGFVVGLISPVSGVPGPAVALMLTLQGKQNEIVKLTPPFLLINAIVRIAGLIAVNRFNAPTLRAALVMAPFGMLGVYGGQRFGSRMPVRQLQYLILTVVAASGVWMVAR